MLCENFDDGSVHRIKEVNKPFGLIATELFTQEHLPEGYEIRRANFAEVAKRASFIWSVFDKPEYLEFGVPYAHIPLSWVPEMFKTADRIPFFDVCVFGTQNYERKKIRDQMDRAGINWQWCAYGTMPEDRDNAISMARFVLNLPAAFSKNTPSPARISAALHNNRPLLDPQDISKFDDMRDNWRQIRDQQLVEFQKRTMRDVIKKALECLNGDL
jgi:hypothetical protein